MTRTKPRPLRTEYDRLVDTAFAYAETDPAKAREALLSARRLIANHLDDPDWQAADADLARAIASLRRDV